MKKTIFSMGVIALSFLTASVFAQTPETQPAQPSQPNQPATETKPADNWDYKKNPTVAAILSKYESRYITTKSELSDEDYYPVIGQYESANEEAPSVLIALDAENRGTVWIEGLPQGKIKAYLRKSPAVYKIPAQKTEDGKSVAEGTLIFDKEANTLNILIGKDYNTADPASVFVVAEEVEAKPKSKKAPKVKTWSYTGNKVIVVEEEVKTETEAGSEAAETNQ
jgi:hypothetical protein